MWMFEWLFNWLNWVINIVHDLKDCYLNEIMCNWDWLVVESFEWSNKGKSINGLGYQ
jgi:hypothetical protein